MLLKNIFRFQNRSPLRFVGRTPNVRSIGVPRSGFLRQTSSNPRGTTTHLLIPSAIGSVVFVSWMSTKVSANDKKEVPTIFDFKVKDIDGNIVHLDKYSGKVCLVVNVASK